MSELNQVQKVVPSRDFPARVGPVGFLVLAFVSQAGMSIVQQGLVILGSFFAVAFHLSLTEMGLITTALSLGVMVGFALAGAAVDRVGPRVLLFWGAACMTGLALVFLRVRTFDVLLSILFVMGMVLAIVPSAGTKAVFTAFEGRPRGLVMGIRQTGVPVGAAIAAYALPQLVHHYGLHGVYLSFALDLLVTGWVFSAVIPGWRKKSADHVHVRMEVQHWRRLARPALVAFFMVAGQYILLTYSIADLHQVHHISLVGAGGILALSQLGGGLGRIILGQWSDRIGGQRPPVLAYTAALGAVFAFTVGLLPASAPIWSLFVIWTFFGFAAIGWNALALTWAGESVPPVHSGLAMSLTGSIVFLGSSVFSPLFGVVVDVTHHLATGWWMLAFLLLIAATLAWRAARSSG